MSTVHSVQDFKASKISVRIAIASMLVIPLVGVGCLVFPAIAEEVLPYFLGIPMIVSGASSIVAVARERSFEAGKSSLGTAIVLCVLGAVTMVRGAESTFFIGTIWGLLGLYKAAGEFDDIVGAYKAKKPFALSLAWCLFQLVLCVLLILNPFANIEHHLIMLGLELIAYPFKLHREHGKTIVEAEA